ncbi:unnamed protein product [Leptosia nina]|uniref:Chemosensory protein n=1 Tax=Leptosia nina TaxID=320188 RepID=A0AAV1JT84_9NEOP
MKVIVLLAVVALVSAQENLEQAIADPAKLQGLVDCFLDRAPCSDGPAGFKEMTPKALETSCGNCNPAQRHLANVFFGALQKNLPNEFDNFVNKYDPSRQHIDSFLQSIQGA